MFYQIELKLSLAAASIEYVKQSVKRESLSLHLKPS